MPGSNKVADILHKTVTGGLVLVTAFALADVTRGFGVLHAAAEQEQVDAGQKD
uniref:Uncharacterized protein n=1 Tax=Phytophthora ramorum TaxID=164328 RepID=H3HC74_PHYRM